MYLAAFRVVVKILVLLQPVFVALFFTFQNNIGNYHGLLWRINFAARRGPSPRPPLLRHWYTYIFLIKKIDHRNINFN